MIAGVIGFSPGIHVCAKMVVRGDSFFVVVWRTKMGHLMACIFVLVHSDMSSSFIFFGV